jgi:hypothetical protein
MPNVRPSNVPPQAVPPDAPVVPQAVQPDAPTASAVTGEQAGWSMSSTSTFDVSTATSFFRTPTFRNAVNAVSPRPATPPEPMPRNWDKWTYWHGEAQHDVIREELRRVAPDREPVGADPLAENAIYRLVDCPMRGQRVSVEWWDDEAQDVKTVKSNIPVHSFKYYVEIGLLVPLCGTLKARVSAAVPVRAAEPDDESDEADVEQPARETQTMSESERVDFGRLYRQTVENMEIAREERRLQAMRNAADAAVAQIGGMTVPLPISEQVLEGVLDERSNQATAEAE